MKEEISKYKNLIFLCGARDFHAMDWYRRSLEELNNIYIYIYSNLSPIIEAKKDSRIDISIFDEIVK